MNVSKELLSEVLGYAVSSIYIAPNGNFIEAQSKYRDERISIYEFQHKCKEWAYERDFYIYSIFTFAGEGACYVTKDNEVQKRLATFAGDSEPEAVFKATSYIMEQLKQKD